jgi:acyl-CoA thioester hydrolase
MKRRDSSAAIETDAPYCREFRVTRDAIDQNGHVNNVVYIQWMQDLAIHHSEACGGTAAIEEMGCSWIVRSHKIDYLSPAYAGEHIVALTWVVDFRKVRSLRKYRFLRKEDGKVLAGGETDWVFVNSVSGRPCAIPEEVKACFPLLPHYP